jgi:hypothetical protein
MKNIDHVIQKLKDNSNLCTWGGGVQKVDIEWAQNQLNFIFPPSYMKFLEEFGAGEIGSRELYGLFKERINDSNLVHINHKMKIKIPPGFLIIYTYGDGTNVFLNGNDKAVDGEYPVGIFNGLAYEENFEVISNDFGEFLLRIAKTIIDKQYNLR